mmetsp:Transcript_31880/g.83309  ORF Transcript_31880/g.83309 Transcript_31880/m.83309 type:complete len:95 (+) Transcript_31880:1-285(+)
METTMLISRASRTVTSSMASLHALCTPVSDSVACALRLLRRGGAVCVALAHHVLDIGLFSTRCLPQFDVWHTQHIANGAVPDGGFARHWNSTIV